MLIVKRTIVFMMALIIGITVSQITALEKAEASMVHVGSYPNGWSAYLITDTIELDEESGILYCQVLAKDPNSDNDTPVLYGFTVEGVSNS